MSINQRIKKIIDIKMSGAQNRFAEAIEATPQYVAKLIKEGGSVGLEPITKILKLYPDINARWLILGDGEMLDQSEINSIKFDLHRNVQMLLRVEQYLPYMTDEEIKQYRDAATNLKPYDYSERQIERWSKLSEEHGS